MLFSALDPFLSKLNLRWARVPVTISEDIRAANTEHKHSDMVLKELRYRQSTLYTQGISYFQQSNYSSLKRQVSQKCLLLTHPAGYFFKPPLGPQYATSAF